ncbi:MAG: polyprenol monophosphomannose synthase [Phycisphaerales bacterium]|nr:MAG: polyprenol monophosphomannose synthase [Phycisphaerales bacterium]
MPTFKEAENLPNLIPAVSEALSRADLPHEIIVVDDDSADGTGQLIGELAERFPVRLIVRKDQRGLASAVVHGFRQAEGAVLVCMDADGSHPPTSVPELVRAIVNDHAEIALGSRFIVGGSTDDQWSLYRRWNSRLATWPARLLTGVRDPMSGFFAISRERFEAAPATGPRALNPIGYKILLELIVKTNARNCAEIPIHFRRRELGRSKLSLGVQAAYAWQLVKLMVFRASRPARVR